MTYLFGDKHRRPQAAGQHLQPEVNNTSNHHDGVILEQSPVSATLQPEPLIDSSDSLRDGTFPEQTRVSATRQPASQIESSGSLLDGLEFEESPASTAPRSASASTDGSPYASSSIERQAYPSLLQKLLDLKARNGDDLTQEQAFQLAIEAAELNMKYLKLANNKRDKNDRRVLSSALLDEAEQIKTTPASIWSPAKVQNLIDFEPLELSPVTAVRPLESPAPMGPSHVSQKPSSAFSDSPVLSETTASTRQTPKKAESPAPIHISEISKREQLLLWRASAMPGGPFPPWGDEKTRNSNHGWFASTGTMYTDATDFGLSSDQMSLLEGWKRPPQALPPPNFTLQSETNSKNQESSVTMLASVPMDLVQDAGTNCSLVASLCSAMARSERFADLISCVLLPWDETQGLPSFSPNGKYVAKLNFNGCFRKVQIDDRLPVSKGERLLHVFDRNNPRLLWPALVEKAYMKIRGGFAFPGSNSCTDLWTLTAWIPELCSLHHEATDIDALWRRVYRAFGYGDVLVTIGTGKLSWKTSKAIGLVSEHAYAVLDLCGDPQGPRMLIKNPWINGTKWKPPHDRPVKHGDHFEEEEDGAADDEDEFRSAVGNLDSRSPSPVKEQNALDEEDSLQPGTFWMKLSEVVQNFDTLYLNWNPGLFTHRMDAHFEWDLSSDRTPYNSFRTNPQYALVSEMDDSVWIVLSKHFRTERRTDGMPAHKEEFLSLYAYAGAGGRRVILSKGASQKLPYHDSHQTLMKLEVLAGVTQTIVVVGEDLGDSKYNFTMSAFGRYNLRLSEAKEQYSDQISVTGAWNATNSGVPSSSVMYRRNLQYVLYLPATSKVAILLEAPSTRANVMVRLFHSGGKRLHEFRPQDLIADSGKYQLGCCLATINEPLPAGGYTIVVGTHEQHADTAFKLHAYSNVNTSLNPCHREGAGRLHQRLADVSFPPKVSKMSAPISPERYAMIYFEVTHAQPPNTTFETLASPVRLTIEQGRGDDRRILISSGGGTFRDASGGVRTEDLTISPPPTTGKQRALVRDMHLVLERMPSEFAGQTQSEERFKVDAYADTFNWAQMGVWRSVDR